MEEGLSVRVDLARGPCVECQEEMMGGKDVGGEIRWAGGKVNFQREMRQDIRTASRPRPLQYSIHSDHSTELFYRLIAIHLGTPKTYTYRVSSTELIYHPSLLSPPTHGVSLQ